MGGGGGSLRQLRGGDSLTALRPPRLGAPACQTYSLSQSWDGSLGRDLELVLLPPTPASFAFMAQRVWPVSELCVEGGLAFAAV